MDHGPGSGQVLRYLVALFFLCSSLLSNAQAPTANFTSNKVSGCATLVVNFQDQSKEILNSGIGILGTDNYQIFRILWGISNSRNLYGDLSCAERKRHTWCHKTDYITVFPSPSWDFTSDKTIACQPATIQFTDASINPVGTIVKWEWDFGDGGTASTQNLHIPIKYRLLHGFFEGYQFNWLYFAGRENSGTSG
jgi:hypothetical protein